MQSPVLLAKLIRYAPAQLASCISIFGLLAAHTHLLDIKTYGVLALSIILLEIARTAASQWIGAALLRLTPGCTETKKRALLGTGLAISIALTCTASIILTIGVTQYNLLNVKGCIALAALLLIKSIYLHLLDLCRLSDNASRLTALTLAQAILSIVFTIILLKQASTVQNALTALCISYLIPSLLAVKLINFSYGKDEQKKILSYGMPLLVSGTLATLSSKIDKIVISELLNLEAAGYYAALSNLTLGVISIVFIIVATPLYPELAKAASLNNDLEKTHSKYLSILLAITMPSAVGLCLISSEFTNLFLPTNYTHLHDSQKIFWLLTASAFLYNFKGHYIEHSFQFLLRTRHLPWLSLLTALFSVTTISILIELLGIKGAAWGWLATNIIAILISYRLSMNLGYSYKLSSDVPKIIASCIIMILAFRYISPIFELENTAIDLISKILLGLTTYLTSLAIMNTFQIRKKLSAKQVKNEV